MAVWSAVPFVDRSSTGIEVEDWLNSHHDDGLLARQLQAARCRPAFWIAVSPDASAVHGRLLDQTPRAATFDANQSVVTLSPNRIVPPAPGVDSALSSADPPPAWVHVWLV